MRARDFLLENTDRYMPMFNMFKGMVNDDYFARGGKFEQAIAEYKRALKRQDRIVWGLRWYRLTQAMAISLFREERDKLIKPICHELGIETFQADGFANYFSRNWGQLMHLLSLPAPQIQSYVFDRQLPNFLLSELTKLEEEWIEKGNNQVIDHSHNPDSPYRPEPTVLIDFKDGWYWFDLNIDACAIEGKAMGHCGNEQNREDDDTVLSLRRHMGGSEYRPSVTAVLHNDGYLGEIKGRANQKPKAEYHPYIVKLLMDARVKGIHGGGHDPKNNFSVFDLPEAQAKQLIDQKPELVSNIGDIAAYWNENQHNEFAKQILDQKVHTYFKNQCERIENNRIIVTEYTFEDWEKYIIPKAYAPSDLMSSFYEEFHLPKNDLYWRLMVALVPHDVVFNLTHVEARLDIATMKVQTYLPYSGLAYAFSENHTDYFDGDAPPLFIETYETIDDIDDSLFFSLEERYREFASAIDYSGFPDQELASLMVDIVCSGTKGPVVQMERIRLAKRLQRL